jgi:hypothetical protein
MGIEKACEVLDPIRENFNLYAFTNVGMARYPFFPYILMVIEPNKGKSTYLGTQTCFYLTLVHD